MKAPRPRIYIQGFKSLGRYNQSSPARPNEEAARKDLPAHIPDQRMTRPEKVNSRHPGMAHGFCPDLEDE
jgi:hypothetical protein